VLQTESDTPLLLATRIGQGEAVDRKIRRRGPIADRRNDARRQEGKRSQQADVPLSLDLTLGNLGERTNAAEPDFVDPSSSFGDCGKQRLVGLGLHRNPANKE
jgi:hypothetical protein